ncbi:hypothetical protein ATANTOWER_023222 [Ataeniobius toweri]|uniref:Uncharacterized protein n=1 Tax=Ataeniobius toweri TaxID=208326 RepID=A0ABU7B953_9TELE|nr:hypothetical protein [Ataeniobius toweri]
MTNPLHHHHPDTSTRLCRPDGSAELIYSHAARTVNGTWMDLWSLNVLNCSSEPEFSPCSGSLLLLSFSLIHLKGEQQCACWPLSGNNEQFSCKAPINVQEVKLIAADIRGRLSAIDQLLSISQSAAALC